MQTILSRTAEAFRPPPTLTVSEWADAERRLSPEASAEPGRWYTSRAEYLRGIMDAISDPAIRQVVVMSSAQVGKTEFILNVIGYHIDQDAAPILCIQPTLQMAQSFSKDRLAPMLRDTPALQGKVRDPRARDSGNTTLHKVFPGGHITIAGANSAAGLASRPVRIVLCDEVDRYPSSAGTEGDPIRLAAKRATTFWNAKLVTVSTPTVKNASRIEAEWLESDQREYHVRCQHCGEAQTLAWKQVQWKEGAAHSAAYICAHCGVVWNDADRFKAIKSGEWIAQNPHNGIAGFRLSGLYSPWVPLSEAVRDFLEAKKLPETLRVWVNTFLGETWEEQGDGLDEADISQNREDYSQVPSEVHLLTAGCDVQDDRIEVEVVGWGRDEESWSIDHAIIYGDPSTPVLWSDLDVYLSQKFETEDGRSLAIRSSAIDSGGHYTQAVYNFVRPRESRRVFAIKGVGGEGKPLAGRPSRNNIGKIRLFPIGVDTAKELIYARLKIEEPGPGYCHFPAHYDDEYFAQLTAEQIVTRFNRGFRKREWKKTRARNEALDLRVYAIAAYAIINANINAIIDAQSTPDQQKPKFNRQVSRRQNFATAWR
jgi:phage terminase large subunit GpA-like protein